MGEFLLLKTICRVLCVCCATIWIGPSVSLADGSHSGKPTISIKAPLNGAVVHGSNLTVHVSVSNFTLAPPAPVSSGAKPSSSGSAASKPDTGHIQYVLDNQSNFNPKLDATTSQTHTWNHVAPGPHTVTAYLANNQYVAIPAVKQARISLAVVVPPHSMGQHQGQTTSQPRPRPTSSPTAPPASINGAPTTGGGADITHSSLNLSLLMAGGLLVVLGALFFASRRLIFAGQSGSPGPGMPIEETISPSQQGVARPAPTGVAGPAPTERGEEAMPAGTLDE